MKEGIKILFIAPRYHTNQHFLVRALKNNGHQVKFLVLYKSVSEEYSELEPQVIQYSGIFKIIARLRKDPPNKMTKFKMKFAFPSIIDLYKSISSYRPELIIVREFGNFSFMTTILAFILSIDVVYYTQVPMCSNQPTGKRERLLKFIEKIFHKKVPRITPIPGDCNQNPPSPNTYYLPFAVDFKHHRRKEEYYRDGFINILMVGKLIPRKNHLMLLNTLNKLKDKFSIRLTIIAGEEVSADYGEYPSLVKKYILENDLSSLVQIKKNLSFSDMAKEYAYHDLFIIPSHDEPFSISALEAMAHGLAVICSDTNGARYYLKEGIYGLIFKTGDEDDLCEKVSIILKDQDNLVKMGQTALTAAEKDFSLKKYYSEFQNLLKKLGI